MSEPIIRVENLGKKYLIRHKSEGPRHNAFRDVLAEAVRGVGRRFWGSNHQNVAAREEFWALKDVSFEIAPGEVVGIIGGNGAGKSTLLKILSRITEPTTGRVALNGRVSSLLEVGTGFHPELTGRENVYLNGAILGMSRAEIARKFDAIVAFSESEKFLDTPVKRYSSGMYMRLAFSVAAHLEPEILIVDEVLAVGDNNYQRKCINKMKDVAGEGRTVLFVSHNMNAITRLCPRAILLRQGMVIADGSSQVVTRTYLSTGSGIISARSWPERESAPGNNIVRLRSVRVHDDSGQSIEVADIRQPVGIEMIFDVLEAGHVLAAVYHLANEEGVKAFVVHDVSDPAWHRRPRPAGQFKSTVWIPGNFLAEGLMVVSPAVSTHNPEKVHFQVNDAIGFQVADSHDGDSARGDYVGHYPGIVRPLLQWTTEHRPFFESALAAAGC